MCAISGCTIGTGNQFFSSFGVVCVIHEIRFILKNHLMFLSVFLFSWLLF